MIDTRISSSKSSLISSSKEEFCNAAPDYNDVLKRSRYQEDIKHWPQVIDKEKEKTKSKRKRNIMWFNPPYSKNIETNIGKQLLL